MWGRDHVNPFCVNSLSHVLVGHPKDCFRLAPEIGVKHVFVQLEDRRYLSKGRWYQKDVFVHIFVQLGTTYLIQLGTYQIENQRCHQLQLHTRLLERLID